MNRDTRTFGIVLTCFFLSGLAALLYQTVWMRVFSIAFGTSELAVVTVLMAYMGGLALGAALITRVLGRLQRPVMVYALLELGIALSAALVPTALNAVRALHVSLMGGLPELPDSAGLGKGLFYLAAGFLILMIPTAFMGATLPLLAKGVVHTRAEIGRRIGLLYGINTVGAVFGTLLAAFVLMPALGMRLTAMTGVAINVFVALLGFAVARHMRTGAGTAGDNRGTGITKNAAEDENEEGVLRWAKMVFPLMLVSGALSFSYEVLWTRLLGQVVGGSLAGFATMLASFLTGIALGSLIASRLARSAALSARGLALAQLGTGVLSMMVYYLLSCIPEWSLQFRLGGWSTTHWSTLISALVLLPSTICIGATYPFAVRIVARRSRDAAQASAWMYSWNTAGAITGAFLAGFFLIPGLGFEGMLRLAVTGNVLLAGAALLVVAPPHRQKAVTMAALAAVLLTALCFRPAPPSEMLQATRFAGTQQAAASGELLYYSVGRSATVVVVEAAGALSLRTNGLPEADLATPGTLIPMASTPHWLGVLPSLLHPEGKSALVIGFGGGTVIEGIPPSVETIDVVELEEKVIEANRALASRRRFDPLSDPRVRVVLNDARGALALTEKKWDIIISQPSHPWTAGASHLYTRESMAEVRAHLNEGGVFLQWMGTSIIDDPLARSLVATVREVFPHLQVYLVGDAILIVSSMEPIRAPASLQDGADEKGSILGRSNWAGLPFVEDAAAALMMDEQGAARYAAGMKASTDDHNLIALNSPRVIDRPDRELRGKSAAYWRPYDVYRESGLLTELAEDSRWWMSRFLLKLGDQQRPGRSGYVSAHLDEPSAAMARGTMALAREDFAACLPEFLQALEHDRENREARFYAAYACFRMIPFESGRERVFVPAEEVTGMTADERKMRELAAEMSDDERLVLEAVYAAARDQWARLREMDDQLGRSLDPRSVLYPLVTVIRARAWLLDEETGDQQAAARKALDIVETALGTGVTNHQLVELRGIAAAISGEDEVFADVIWGLLRPLAQTPTDEAGQQEQRLALEMARRLLGTHLPPPAQRSPELQKLVDEVLAFEAELNPQRFSHK